MKKLNWTLENKSQYGLMMMTIGAIILVPLLILFWKIDELKFWTAFVIPGAVLLVAGYCVCVFGRTRTEAESRRRMGESSGALVLFSWGVGILAGAAPFVLAGELSPFHATFEAVSGFTTTGLSVMDVTKTADIFLFHRAWMQFCGGLGFVMMVLLIAQGKQSMNLYAAEGHPDKLMPTLGKTVRAILMMYVGFLICGTAAYLLTGMNLLDSVTNAMCALSTGGFSTQADSIGAYKSAAVEGITIALMLIGTTNFAVLLLLVRGRFKRFWQSTEPRFLLGLLVIFVPIIAGLLAGGLYMSFGEGLRLSLFNVVSALSTSGFSTAPYTNWPAAAIGLMTILMLIGGGMGSTAGGMKLIRVSISLRLLWENIRQRMLPAHSVTTLHYTRAQGRTQIDRDTTREALSYVGAYLILFITGSLLVSILANASLQDAMFEFASALGTVGLSIGLKGPMTNWGVLLLEMIGMLLGRLEIFVILTTIASTCRHAFIRGRMK